MPKLKAITEARGGTEERIYVRGDRKVDYGTVMKVMGRLSGAGFHRVALVTEIEQGVERQGVCARASPYRPPPTQPCWRGAC